MRVSNTSLRLKEALERLGMSQTELANRTNLSESIISQYLSGVRSPKQSTLTTLGKALNVTEVWLMGYDVDYKRSPITKIETKSHEYKVINAYVEAEDYVRKAIDDLLKIEH